MIRRTLLVTACLLFSHLAYAAKGESDVPIEIHSDTLDVFQNENKAIFKGNVIATQGEKNLRSVQMTVFYRGEGKAPEATAKDVDAAAEKAKASTATTTTAKGIYRIEAVGDVVFTTPEDTATGERGVYDVDADTIELFGSNVTLTHGQNVIKGTHVVHNMTSGRSIMTSGSGEGGKPARVHGLFIPESKDKKAGEK